ncbi:response regulator transcription factor [Shouchella clausii]|uniref:response regulator transcription factor n=1 Tax=Shouchella TaxID=2893057 RepID=UPI0006B32CC4|nr:MULTISPECIES: response regulator transcription factor [Shouchella]ALA50954.1 DNA-binding response regulator [Shouchella clausii]MBU3231760.1 response regulator transcription factor [Shouchella clausii]MBU3264956.1 response regulator transcription factor [Shouchella clausii]MBU3507581.1 response regulator transcription factor [Shouchella clausii]MBX0306946.1 response regulator transcription factor [Shouchella clausii]
MAILLIEDDRSIATIVKEYLERESFKVVWQADGESGYHAFCEGAYQLVLIDLMLPKMDGFALCEKIRASSEVPIIVVSAKQTDFDKVQSFGLGADDYVTKPFSPLELTARVKAQIRRYERSYPQQEDRLQFIDVEIDITGRRVFARGEQISLTAKEFELLLFLANHPGRVFTKEELYAAVWNGDGFDSRTVTVHVKNVRHKLKDGTKHPKYIETVWGVGYKFIGLGNR